jgi:hypothetical protein
MNSRPGQFNCRQFVCAAGIVIAVTGCNHRDPVSSTPSLPPPPPLMVDVPDFATARKANELIVRELVFRELLKQPRQGLCFLSYGPAGSEQWIDVSDEMLRRLSDLKLPLRKVSEAQFPLRGSVYWVKFIRWTPEGYAEVEAGRDSGPLDGAGFKTRVKKLDGVWRIDPPTESWVS